MLTIRFARVGRKKQAFYRVVVSEKTKDMYGNHLEILGTHNPHTKETVLKKDRIEHWLKVGAQTSDVVRNLFIKEEIIKADKKAKAVSISKKRQAKIDGKKEEAKPKEDKPAEEVKEEKTEDKPAEAPSETKEEDKK